MNKFQMMIVNFLIREKEVNYINGNELLKEPLDKEREAEYLLKYKNGDMKARDKLIEHNLRLVVFISRKYEQDSFYLEDIVSIGTIGLIKAIQTFDVSKNIKLATYASRCIENEILMYMRKKSKLKMEVSLDEPLNIDYDGNELLLQDVLTSHDKDIFECLENESKKEKMFKAIGGLKPKEKEILYLRYGILSGEEMTQKDVANYLGISQSYISRLEKRIIKKLKAQIIK